MIVQYQNELYHYGVPGMKWGHRKSIASGVYGINARYYNKRAQKYTFKANRNKSMANLNRNAAGNGNGIISKVNRLNAKYYDNRANKLTAKANKSKLMADLNTNAQQKAIARKEERLKSTKSSKAHYRKGGSDFVKKYSKTSVKKR